MKKSLANQKREKYQTSEIKNYISIKSPLKKLCPQQQVQNSQRITINQNMILAVKLKENRYEVMLQNKNLNSIPSILFDSLGSLLVLDISNNQLVDKQIELVMNNGLKLVKLNIIGNRTTLIPVALGKMKYLSDFLHDWIKLNQNIGCYEERQQLKKILQVIKKPDIVIKINKIVGLDFLGYCQYILDIAMNNNLLQKILKCTCSLFAKNNMVRYMQEIYKGKLIQKQKKIIINQGDQKIKWPGCFATQTFYLDKKKKKKFMYQKKQLYSNCKEIQSQISTDAASTTIKSIIWINTVQDIRDINEKEETLTTADGSNKDLLPYQSPGMLLHKIFANFDNNPKNISQIDELLISGYNPNQYDNNGLSPYHICVIHRQWKGVEYLLEISANNPGFFDLEMLSVKEGRNILHYSIFLKDYIITKILIQFGFPTNKKDVSGARIIHLVDQNYQFLLLLRKMLKKKVNVVLCNSILSQKRQLYVKHPGRLKQESVFKICEYNNLKLLEMYQSAVGIPCNLMMRS